MLALSVMELVIYFSMMFFGTWMFMSPEWWYCNIFRHIQVFKNTKPSMIIRIRFFAVMLFIFSLVAVTRFTLSMISKTPPYSAF